MTSLIHADIFFFVATIGISILSILVALMLIYAILILRRWHRMSKQIESDVLSVREQIKSFFESIVESKILSWILKKKQTKKKE